MHMRRNISRLVKSITKYVHPEIFSNFPYQDQEYKRKNKMEIKQISELSSKLYEFIKRNQGISKKRIGIICFHEKKTMDLFEYFHSTFLQNRDFVYTFILSGKLYKKY